MIGVRRLSHLTRLLFAALLITLLAAVLLPTSPALASSLPSGWEKKVSEYVSSEMEALEIPGAAVAIVAGNEVVLARGFGMAEKERQVTPQTPFLVASVSKHLTSLAVVQLIEAGRLQLADTMGELFPNLVPDDSPVAGVTVENLLGHTSGWSHLTGARALEDDDQSPEALAHNAARILATPLSHPIGEFEYDNSNYDLLGYIVSVVSGQTYEKYMETNVFTPLGMTNTFTNEKEALKDGLAAGHYPVFGVVTPLKMRFAPASCPSAFIYTSAEDLAHVLLAELDEGRYGGKSVLSPDAVTLLRTPLSHPNLQWGYAMGLYVGPLRSAGRLTDEQEVGLEYHVPVILEHEGDHASYAANILMLPEEKLGVVVLFNVNDYSKPSVYHQMHIGIANILLGYEPPATSALESGVNRYGKVLALGLVVLALIRIALSALWFWRRGKSATGSKLSTTTILRRLVLPLLVELVVLGALWWFLAYTGRQNNGSLALLPRFVPDIFWSWVSMTVIVLGWRVAVSVLTVRTFSRSGPSQPLSE